MPNRIVILNYYLIQKKSKDITITVWFLEVGGDVNVIEVTVRGQSRNASL